MDGVLLTERIKQGDRAAFDELYKLNYIPLRSYARLLLDEDEAEDVVQDVFFNLWLRRESLEESLSIRGYLLRSVYNTALNVLKRKNLQDTYGSAYRQEIEEMGRQDFYNPEGEIVRRFYNRDLRADINQAIESLPPRQREVFSLSYLQDMSGKQISEKLGISLSTVENHINAALKILRVKLGRYKNNLGLAIVLCKIIEKIWPF